MRIKIAHLHARARARPKGYLAECLSRGTIDGDHVEFDDETYSQLCTKYRDDGPTVRELVIDFAGSLDRWLQAGTPVVTHDTFSERLVVCQQCKYWRRSDYTKYLDRCGYCGCFNVKLWLGTEKCPDGRWKETVNNGE